MNIWIIMLITTIRIKITMTSDEAEAVLTYQQLQTTAVLSGPTSTTEEKLILTPTKGSTITPT